MRLSDDAESAEPNPELNAPVIYEDEDVAVFDKPPHMPVHPSIRHRGDTLANLFAALYPGLPFRPINRLDRNTSGLCVCAKNQYAASALSGSLSKVYFAVTCGTPPGDTVDAPIGRAGDSIITRCVTPEGQRAVTHFERVGRERFPRASEGRAGDRAYAPDTRTYGVHRISAVRGRNVRRGHVRDKAACAPLRRGELHPAGHKGNHQADFSASGGYV